MRGYDLPKRDEGETNWEWCQRVARTIPPELLLKEIVRTLQYQEKTSRNKTPAWSRMGMLTNHGAGVSQAIIQRYEDKDYL